MANNERERKAPAKGTHSAPSRRREGAKKAAPARKAGAGHRGMLLAGWGFLAAVILLAAAVFVRLLPEREEAPAIVPTAAPGPAGSAFTVQTEQQLSSGDGRGGRSVSVKSVDCGFMPPAEITFGRLSTVDLSDIGKKVSDNVRAAGWGDTVWSVTENGALLIRAANMTALSGADFEKQSAFLKTDKPEQISRTFLDNSGLIGLLRDYGLTLSTQVENNDGEILFRGTGTLPGCECTARFTFLYTGAFDQAVIRAVYLADAVTVSDVIPLSKAASRAVTWMAGTGESVVVTDAELRHVSGLPFYALTCSDGTTAFALAVDEDALSAVPGARETYDSLMSDGIENNVSLSGGE